MVVHFAFSDENGAYQQIRSHRFCDRVPYFIRSNLLIRSDEWLLLRATIDALRSNLHSAADAQEVKWAHLWQLKRFHAQGQAIDPAGALGFLSRCSYQDVMNYVEACLEAVAKLRSPCVILTVTNNKVCPRIAPGKLYRMHLQEAMQRIEMEMHPDNLCALFVDAVSPEQNKHLRDAYHEIYRSGDFIKKYQRILDSLNMIYSHQSVGIQLADFIAGAFSGFLRGYPQGIRLFKSHIVPLLRMGRGRQIVGYGVREVPRHDEFRSELRDKLEPHINEAVEARMRSLFKISGR